MDTSQDSAQAALELSGRELEPGMALNVYISNPQRKKERTDANVEQREIYVAGLAKSTKQNELEELFGEVCDYLCSDIMSNAETGAYCCSADRSRECDCPWTIKEKQKVSVSSSSNTR